MQLFSQKKALVALSLGALAALGACGDDVNVTPPTPAVVVVTMSPQNATMNIGESLNLAVQITGGSPTPTLASCTSSNTAVATAASQGGNACRVTAVSSGNVTITAATSGSQVAATSITVAPAAAAISGLTTSPTTAGLSVGQTLTIVPNVTRAASTVTVTYAYASSNAAIASVNATSGVVTAVAPGTATITVTANGSGTGFTTSALTSGVTVNVTAAPPALTGLTVTPMALSMAVGTTRTISATVAAAAGITAPAATFTSNASTIASVNAAGLVTGVAPGNAQITVTATSPGNATLAATTLTQVVNVEVSPLANVTIQSIIQGPYVTTGLDSTFTGWSPASQPGSGPTGPNTGTIAGIRVAPNGQIDQSVDVTNTKDQIQVVLNLQTNGQRVDSVVVYIDPANAGRRAAARQTFSQAPSANTEVRLYILTEDFTPNAGTGVGDVHYSNGLKAISASVWVGNTEIQNASAARQNINFNNIDGFALTVTRPANTTLDVNSRSWWGGPTTSDIGQQTGLTSFQAWPVIYTPGRSIIRISGGFGRCRGFGAGGLPNFLNDTLPPFVFSAGTGASATTTTGAVTHIGCGGIVGAYDLSDQFRFEDYPVVVASLDNQQNPGPRTIYAYNPSLGTDPFAGPRPTLYRNSPQVTAPPAFRIDYEAPSLGLVVTQSNGERWVNDAYAFNTGYTATDNVSFPVSVGLFATASRNFVFSAAGATSCPSGAVGTTLTTVGTTIATIPASVVAPNREHPCDFTNNAFTARATETDRLGNRGTSNSPLFGIDNTAPEMSTAWDGAGPIPDMPNHYLATNDSIFQPAGAVPATPVALVGGATDFWFGVRYRDTRSGFNISNHGTRTVKRFYPNASPLSSNVARLDTVDSRTMNFIGGTGNPVENEDPTFRRDSITVYGRGGLSGTSGTANPAVASSAVLVGYYQYEISLVDRALNTSTLRQRSSVDRTSPQITGVTIPSVWGAQTLTGAAPTQAFYPTGSDDVEAFDADLFLRYPAFDVTGDGSIGSLVSSNAARVMFRRERGGLLGFPNWHNPWQVFSDTLLATPFGPGARLSDAQSGSVMPIPSIRGIEPVDSTNAPVAWGVSGATNPFAGFKPNQVGLYAYDVRASHRGATAAPALFPAPYAANPPFWNLGATNTLPGFESAYTEPLFAANVANGSRWDVKDLNPATAANDLMLTWAVFSTGTTLQARVTTSTIVTQPPFPTVSLFKWEADARHTGSGTTGVATTVVDSAAGNWVYITSMNSSGAPANPSLFDQGSTRFWTYSMTFAQHNIGALTQDGTIAAGCYRAVGSDASGDGVVTQSFGTGCPAVVAVAAGTNPTVTLRAYGNGTGTIVATSGPAHTLTKVGGQYVERTSQNRASVLTTYLITPTSGTLQQAPTGCTTTTVVTYPTSLPVTCTINAGFGPRTINAIFEAP